MKHSLIIILMIWTTLAAGNEKVALTMITGDVKIRRGLDEEWRPASSGTILDTIDSILTGEGEAVLELPDGRTFRISSQTILDIADLRLITEQELFLLLMSDKIQKMPKRSDKTKLEIGDINVVHGSSQQDAATQKKEDSKRELWQMEKNGVIALYNQDFTPNAILKINNILAKYPEIEDCGEIYSYLGNSFEKLDKPGQAIDAYKMVIANSCDSEDSLKRKHAAEMAIQKLER